MKKNGREHRRLVREGQKKAVLRRRCPVAFWNFNRFGSWIQDYTIKDLDVKYSLDMWVIRSRVDPRYADDRI